MLQVIVTGHNLSIPTLQFIGSLGQAKIVNAPLNIDDWNNVVDETCEYLIGLAQRQEVTPGGCRTLFIPSGSSHASITMMAAWKGMTGDDAEVLNLIRNGAGVYVPSPTKPITNLRQVQNEMRRKCRMGLGQGQVRVHHVPHQQGIQL